MRVVLSSQVSDKAYSLGKTLTLVQIFQLAAGKAPKRGSVVLVLNDPDVMDTEQLGVPERDVVAEATDVWQVADIRLRSVPRLPDHHQQRLGRAPRWLGRRLATAAEVTGNALFDGAPSTAPTLPVILNLVDEVDDDVRAPAG
uniref:Uncharacterized protein n=1 Tax=Oryza brachyantha TaxID=4533 RepID=J3KZ48_ORYBR